MPVFFNGRLWISPATMSVVDDTAMYNKNLSVGNVLAIVGKSEGGKPFTALRFGSAAEARAAEAEKRAAEAEAGRAHRAAAEHADRRHRHEADVPVQGPRAVGVGLGRVGVGGGVVGVDGGQVRVTPGVAGHVVVGIGVAVPP